LVPDPDVIIGYFHDVLNELHGLVLQVREETTAPAMTRPAAEPAQLTAALATLDAAPQAASPPPASDGDAATKTQADDLTQLHGIGPAFAARLQTGGITTYAMLASSTAEQLAAIVQAPDWRRPDYLGWIEQAQGRVAGEENS
jgi:predicted flap endonuclease-1-like 5' DNA nuclease